MSTKGSLLKALEENRGITVSGEDLATSLGISRAAVWKAIQELRKDGHCINAVTNKGYCLAPDSDVLSREGILLHVSENDMANRIHVFKSVESTNLTCKKMALEGAPYGTVVIAEEQTKGRGRMGRNFYSPSMSGIYMSFILEPRFDMTKSVLITTAAAVAVCKAIEKVAGISCRIKWVNDIYLEGKKICGILTEAVSDFESGQIEHIVLGIGINYSTAASDFPEELRETAGSLFGNRPVESADDHDDDRPYVGGVTVNNAVTRNRLTAEVINQIFLVNENLGSGNYIREYKERSFVLGKEVLIIPAGGMTNGRNQSEGIKALALDVDSEGGLVVRYQDGSIHTLNSGEISVRTLSS
ncbi:MAG: biotin--[acetyl-CoA-carboxylase] ligase [Eubacteriales bacterium]|nr:biotin--[acetyl-CoA-carboxylase] ligase [Eubacteriales bacterium]MDD3199404.1 biotin--[acetyl-CoA-carboxylase] ligase [Eubacteriales bacterium]MDD4122082.1 biotin--[acetyl-CoA-carboxylase] ligase [Eubacteriales bacterium]MDD4629928.1 biotin--[acetyl-CoA-carboxylase] ligase [Eubacteriales bacterium]